VVLWKKVHSFSRENVACIQLVDYGDVEKLELAIISYIHFQRKGRRKLIAIAL
jgi:hypothetical protein